MLFQYAGPEQLNPAVECGLTAEGKKYTIGFFLFDYSLNEFGSDRQKIHFVCDLFGCLDSCNIRVDQNRRYSFLFQGLQGLGP